MKLENNVGKWGSAMGWAAGAAILAYGIYIAAKKYAKNSTAGASDTATQTEAEPETPITVSAPEAQPYFDPSHQRHQDAYIPKNHVRDHRTHVGNGPGERNQIGGRASGKKARY